MIHFNIPKQWFSISIETHDHSLISVGRDIDIQCPLGLGLKNDPRALKFGPRTFLRETHTKAGRVWSH
jgi:hypothetical protein